MNHVWTVAVHTIVRDADDLEPVVVELYVSAPIAKRRDLILAVNGRECTSRGVPLDPGAPNVFGQWATLVRDWIAGELAYLPALFARRNLFAKRKRIASKLVERIATGGGRTVIRGPAELADQLGTALSRAVEVKDGAA